jgi:hypothetical protein
MIGCARLYRLLGVGVARPARDDRSQLRDNPAYLSVTRVLWCIKGPDNNHQLEKRIRTSSTEEGRIS